MQGEAEYAFWHILTCDVAYAQIPRASRAARHVGAAEWIESKAPGRVEDLADVLAYHYSTALDLARAAGEADWAAELEAPARRFLTLAGERAFGLDTTAALDQPRTSAGADPTRHTPAGRRRSCASPRPHSTPAAPSRRRRRWSRRSHHSRSGAISPPRRTPCTCSPASSTAWPIHAGSDLPAEALALLEPLPKGPAHVEALTEVRACGLPARRK